MEPPVIADGKFEGQPVILQIVFSNINMKTIGGNVVKRPACDLLFFGPSITAADVAVFSQLFLDLYQIFLQKSDIQGCADGF